MEEAEYCNRMALMNRGRLIALDTPRGLRRAVTDPVLQVRTRGAPVVVGALADAPGIREAALFGRAVRVLASDEVAARASIAERIADTGAPPPEIEVVEPTLEDVFVSLVLREDGSEEVR